MADTLFLDDSYLREFSAKIVSVVKLEGEESKAKIVLDRTAFFPTGGGQPCDLGKLAIAKNGAACEVADVRKENGEIVHTVVLPQNCQLETGDEVTGEIDWARRHRHMRMHTAGHVLSAVMFAKGLLITGNQLGANESRFDFSMENFDRALIDTCIAEANTLMARGQEVSISYLPREEALKMPGMSKLTGALPPAISTLRIVKIGDIDTQADGGTHVKNTSEVGTLSISRAENKGKSNRRIYFTLCP